MVLTVRKFLRKNLFISQCSGHRAGVGDDDDDDDDEAVMYLGSSRLPTGKNDDNAAFQ